jgi:carbonic anhydrase/acetyltransferase-like protein (isoleucine patch superfamily)
VTENTVIPPRSLFLGMPARLARKLTDSDRAFIDVHATHYLEYKESYLARPGKNVVR